MKKWLGQQIKKLKGISERFKTALKISLALVLIGIVIWSFFSISTNIGWMTRIGLIVAVLSLGLYDTALNTLKGLGSAENKKPTGEPGWWTHNKWPLLWIVVGVGLGNLICYHLELGFWRVLWNYKSDYHSTWALFMITIIISVFLYSSETKKIKHVAIILIVIIMLGWVNLGLKNSGSEKIEGNQKLLEKIITESNKPQEFVCLAGEWTPDFIVDKKIEWDLPGEITYSVMANGTVLLEGLKGPKIELFPLLQAKGGIARVNTIRFRTDSDAILKIPQSMVRLRKQ